jgi:hypothetical protein
MLNSYKEVWRATEEATTYPDEPSVAATFVLRFVYQQLIWNISQSKMQANFARVRGIFGGLSDDSRRLRHRFEQAFGISFHEFLKADHVLYGLFLSAGASIEDYQLRAAMLARLSMGWTPRLRQANKTLFAVRCKVRCKIVDRQDHCTAF